MKSLTKLCFGLLICLALFICAIGSISVTLAQDQTDQSKVIGIWQGALKVPGGELRIVFRISQNEDRTLAAAMDSPDQGAFGIPTSGTSFRNDSLRIEVKVVMGEFEGKAQFDSAKIVGHWKQSGMTLPLSLKRTDETPKLNRPQEPKKPYPYIEEEIIYQNQKAGIQLAGTLTLPPSAGTHPVVLLITGSGSEDRDETIFAHRPFLILADYLTRQGVAVLRFDDRGTGKSTGEFQSATTEDFASDVLAGINYLKTRKEINLKQIGLIGHSEGGIIAPMVAAQSKVVAFIVLMAGTGLTGEEIMYLQSDLILKATGVSDEVIKTSHSLQERLFEILKQELDDSIAVKKLQQIMKEALAQLSEQEKQAIGKADATIDLQIKQIMSPWFRYFLTYDPKPALMKVKCPVLAINGELDLQVPPKENLAAIEKALKAGGNKNYTIKEFPKLNHLFQTALTGSPSEYAKIEETMAPDVLKFMGDWILVQSAN